MRQLPAGVGPETSEDGGEQGNLLDSVQENLIKDLTRSFKTGKEPAAVVVKQEVATPTTSKKKKKQVITPKKLFSTPGSCTTKKNIKFPYRFMCLNDLPSTPILTGKRLLRSTPLGATKSGGGIALIKPYKKRVGSHRCGILWEKRGWDPVKAIQHADYKAPKGKGKGKGKGKK